MLIDWSLQEVHFHPPPNQPAYTEDQTSKERRWLSQGHGASVLITYNQEPRPPGPCLLPFPP